MRTALVADKDNRVRNIARLVFEHMGYEVVSVWSGSDAVFKAKEIKPDIVLVDVSLSDKDGYKISREIKSDPLLKNTSVILLTASPETFDKTKAVSVRADDFMIKPLKGGEIAEKVEFLTNRNRKRTITYKVKFLTNRNRKRTIKYIDIMLLVIFMATVPTIYKGVDLNLFNVKSNLNWLYTSIKDLGNVNLSQIESEPVPAHEREGNEATSEIKEKIMKKVGIITEVSYDLKQWDSEKISEEIEASQAEKMAIPEEDKSLGAKGEKIKDSMVLKAKNKKGHSFEEVKYRLLKEIQMKVEAKENFREEIEPSQLKTHESSQPEVGAVHIEQKGTGAIRSTLGNSGGSVEPDGVSAGNTNSSGEGKRNSEQ